MASTAKTAKASARKAPAKTAAKKAAPRKAPAKKAAAAPARKVATTGFVWACQCGKTRMEASHPNMAVAGRCPECNTPLALQDD